jgi:hypothetical protein
VPLVKSTSDNPVVPYGVNENSNQKLFQERLMERFRPEEYVKVINVDDEPFRWQYLPAHAEEYQFTPDGMHRHTRRDEPEVWQLEPGESETIVGASAYVMIEALYKKLVSKKAVLTQDVKPGMARAFNYADGTQQEAWINKILVGKEVPIFTSLNDTKVSDEPVKRATRTATTTL